MRILLIDDEAANGWKEVLEKILFNNEEINVALDISSAKIKLEESKYNLIILDLRFGESDHNTIDITTYGGYRVLKEFIRNDFYNLNYSTPVLLFTASNKVWNIFDMMEVGADDYYIKEHPDFADTDFSKKN